MGKTESLQQTKSFNKAPAQGEIEFADEGRIKLHSLITSRRPSVSSGASQELCYQHGLPQRRQSPRQPRCLHSAPDKVGCVASETEHSPGTGTEFPLLCMAWGACKSHSHCPVPQAPRANSSTPESLQKSELLQLLSTPSAVPKDPQGTLPFSSRHVPFGTEQTHGTCMPWQPCPAWQICSLCRQGLLVKDHHD